MDSKVKLSVIIVSFNTKDLLLNCISSLKKYAKNITYEIVVVDNNSSDNSVKEIKRKYLSDKTISIIENKKNIGFAAANNQALKICKGEYILLLNSDTVLTSPFLFDMLEWMDKQIEVGISSCMLHNKDGSIQETGGYFPTFTRIIAWMFFLDDLPILDRIFRSFHPYHSKSITKNIHFYQKLQYPDWVSGAFFLIRRKVFEKVGLIDEDYFMYMEEVDYCFRVKKEGWKVAYNPSWSITHFGGSSSTREYPIVSELKGIKLFYRKHFCRLFRFPIKLILKTGVFLRIILYFIIEGKEGSDVYKKAFSQI